VLIASYSGLDPNQTSDLKGFQDSRIDEKRAKLGPDDLIEETHDVAGASWSS
jgi:hypothetical protein